MSDYFVFGETAVEEDIIENAAEKAFTAAVKALPRECLCIAAIEEILENAKRKTRTMPIEAFLQYPEANRQ